MLSHTSVPLREYVDGIVQFRPAQPDVKIRELAESDPNWVNTAREVFRHWMLRDPEGFARTTDAALSESPKSTRRHMSDTLLLKNDLLLVPLCHPGIFTLEAATRLAKAYLAQEPLLDIRLTRVSWASVSQGGRPTGADFSVRCLEIVEKISDCKRLNVVLRKYLGSPSGAVRAKAALLLSKAFADSKLLAGHFLSEPDPRVRANILEGLWDAPPDPQIAHLYWTGARDIHQRVVGNALVGLCRIGDKRSLDVIRRMAADGSPAFRATAAWAMGESGDPDFRDVLMSMRQDAMPAVRCSALRALVKIRKQANRPSETAPVA